MKYFVLHLNAHQPRRFKKRSTLATPYDDVLNQEALAEDAATVYLPANDLLLRLLRSHDSLCISVSISGVLIELARRFQPEVLASFQELGRVASDTGRVEFVGTTYYHSLAGLFRDGNRDEMKAQADLHRELMNEELGVRPSAFCHAEWMYSNAIGAAAAAVGFQTVLCQGPSANFAHADITTAGFAQHPGKRVGLLLRHGPVSAALCTAGHGDVSAQAFLDDVRRQQERVVLAGIDYENWAGRHWDGTETAVFWEELATLLESADDIAAATPTSVTEKASDSPILTVDDHQPVSRTGGVTEWVGSPAQHELFFRYQDLENRLKTYGDANLLRIWRTLGAACHFYGMQGSEEDEGGDPPVRLRPASDPGEVIISVTSMLTQLADDVRAKLSTIQLRRKIQRPRILLVTPEVTELPAGIGNLANFISAKGGGLADISAALVAEMLRLGLDIHVAIPRYERQMMERARISQQELDRMVSLFQSSEPIHLVPDSAFAHLGSVYESEGSYRPEHRAVAFQRAVINNIMETAMPEHGKMLVHCNDWMTGLVPAAARVRGVVSLFTVHNVHTGHESLRALEGYGIDVSKFWHELYLERHPDSVWNPWETVGVDFLLSGIQAADYVNTVSPTFLEEIVSGYFPDLINWQLREAFRCKYELGCASGIINAPSNSADPRIAHGLHVNYNENNVMEAKRDNKLAFQSKLGLRENGDAPLFFWPHRLYHQKGPGLLADIIIPLIDAYRVDGLQVAVVGNGSPEWEQAFGALACGSNGAVAYARFDPLVSELGKAAADFILMPSLYEPCGLPQMEGMRYGALPIVRSTGGLKDTVQHLDLAHERGNGFVFNDFLPDALWWACSEAMRFYHVPYEQRRRTIRRVMREGMDNFNLERTTLQYVRIYERLIGERLL